MDVLIIYFVYGLVFFLMGFAVLLEALHTRIDIPFSRAMWPLASFGIIHGIHEWLEMFVIIYSQAYLRIIPIWLDGLRVLLLALSFASLLAFSIRLLSPRMRSLRADFFLGVFIFLLWLVSILAIAVVLEPGRPTPPLIRNWLAMSDTWSRYSLAFPGAIIGAVAFWRQARLIEQERPMYAYLIYIGGSALLLYGLIGQSFVQETELFPSNVINSAVFYDLTGVPIQIVRAFLGGILACSIIPTLNMFEVERQQQLNKARQQVQEELQQREQQRHDMLKHMVKMQEEERSRIGREIHDEIGQVLTAISIGLQQIEQHSKECDTARIENIRAMTTRAVSELDHLVTGLRPRHLDHLGLVASLRLLIKQHQERFKLDIAFDCESDIPRIDPDTEMAIFRIVQESLTNIIRHAEIQYANLSLGIKHKTIIVQIRDQGQGFAVEEKLKQGWGLLGMQDRAEQVGGQLTIESTISSGTTITGIFPVKRIMDG